MLLMACRQAPRTDDALLESVGQLLWRLGWGERLPGHADAVGDVVQLAKNLLAAQLVLRGDRADAAQELLVESVERIAPYLTENFVVRFGKGDRSGDAARTQ